MNSEMQLKVQAYLDNELTPGEARRIASLLTTDVEASELFNELKETKVIVAQNEPVLSLPESRDFYWSKIQREIDKTEQITRPPASPWWARFLAPVAGAVALFAVLLSISGSRSGDRPVSLASQVVDRAAATPIHEGEMVVPEMSAITFRSEAQGVTVVWVSSEARHAAAPSLLDLFE